MKTYYIIIKGNDIFEYQTSVEVITFQSAYDFAKSLLISLSGSTIEMLEIDTIMLKD